VVVSDTHSEGLIAAKYNSRKCVAILDLPPIEFFHVYALLADLVIVPLTESKYPLPAPLHAKSSFVGPLIDARSISETKAKSDEELQEEIEIGNRFILVYLSRIHSDRSRFLAAVRGAYQIVLKKHPDMVLVLIGPGAHTEEGDGSNVVAREFVDNIHKYIRASSAFVTRSPIIAMEGLALGKKAVIVPIPADYNQSTMAQSLSKDLVYLPFENLGAERLAWLLEEAVSEERHTQHVAKVQAVSNGMAVSARKILELVNSN
jgi:hypothetical protein